MFVFLLMTKRLQRIRPIDHLFCMLQGACLFCFNFYFFYIASELGVESGVLSVIFSMATIFNVINNRLWHKVVPTKKYCDWGSHWGIGIVLLFYPDF